MERIPPTPMGYIEFLCIDIVPSGFLVSYFKYSFGRRGACLSGGTRTSSDNLPVSFGAFKDSNLLSIMADPDKILCGTGISIHIYESKLPFI